jgi:asparagine synthase (glutamine-hydrolysing)
MCGIAGILHLSFDSSVARADLQAMTDVIEHRGPDAEGFYLEPRLGLGMRRLSIIDPEAGDQPVRNETGRIWAILNGEIYNYRELRADLLRRGHRFLTQADTEVIVHQYEDDGPGFVEKLRGMFAIAVWDVDRQELVLARDRFGIKPLFVAQRGGRMAFASEMKSLFELSWPDLSWRPEAMAAYLRIGYVPQPMTAYQGIRKVVQGTVETWRLKRPNGGGLTATTRYWTPRLPASGPVPSFEDACATTTELLTESIRLHLRSDVPLGAFLSGGVDSSTVVAFMRACGVDDLKTFSIGFADARYNELPHALKVARHLGTDHHTEVVTERHALLLPELLARFDEPFADSSVIPTYFVSRLARRLVTVALSGDGGDELFAGYDAHRRLPAHHRLDRLPEPLRTRLFSGAARVWPETALGGGFVRRMREPVELRYLTLKYGDAHGGELLSRQFRGFLAERGAAAWLEDFRDDGTVACAQLIDQSTYLVDDILAKVDRSSMAVSLEARVPLLDHVLADYVNSLPTSFKLRGQTGKVLLRAVARPHLPPDLFDRPKRGFAIPLRSWLAGPLRRVVEERLVGDQAGLFEARATAGLLAKLTTSRRDMSQWVWNLFALATWAETSGSPRPW